MTLELILYCVCLFRFVVSCIPSWFWGPMVTLEDCLAAFFAADELKGNHTIFDISDCAIMNVTEKGKKKKMYSLATYDVDVYFLFTKQETTCTAVNDVKSKISLINI